MAQVPVKSELLPSTAVHVDDTGGPGRPVVPSTAGRFRGEPWADQNSATPRSTTSPCDLVTEGRATPGFLVSQELTLDEAAAGYDHFDKREDGWTKALLHP